MTTTAELDELTNLFQVPIAAGTLNRGSDIISAGCVVNDWAGFVGLDTTSAELMVFDGIFNLSQIQRSGFSSKIKDLKMENF